MCFWVVLSCSVFVQNKTFRNPQKSFLNLGFFQTWALHRPLQRAGSVEQSGSNTRETVACHCGDWKRTYLQHDKHPLLRRFCESGAVIQDSRPTYSLTYDRHGFSRERLTKRRRSSCEAGKQASTRWRQEATEDTQRARAAMTHWPEQYHDPWISNPGGRGSTPRQRQTLTRPYVHTQHELHSATIWEPHGTCPPPFHQLLRTLGPSGFGPLQLRATGSRFSQGWRLTSGRQMYVIDRVCQNLAAPKTTSVCVSVCQFRSSVNRNVTVMWLWCGSDKTCQSPLTW